MVFRLSPETVRLRFLQPVQAPSPGVGVARYDRLRADPSKAEAAVVVEDAWQGGSRLRDGTSGDRQVQM